MSVSTATRSSSLMRPIATPATCLRSGQPASRSAITQEHTEAIELEPLDSRMSDTRRMV